MLTLIFTVLALTGCSRHAELPESGVDTAILDPQLVRSDHRLYADVDHGAGGLVKLGRGWYQPEYQSHLRRWSLVSWSSQVSSLYFAEPISGPVDLVMDCSPPALEGRPRQKMTVTLNGTTIETSDLADGFQQHRVLLPTSEIVPGLNRIDLSFAWAAEIPDRDGVPDKRTKAAAFRAVALAPRGLTWSQGWRMSSSYDWRRHRLLLFPGSPVALPLPAAMATLRIAEIDDAPSNAELVIDVLERGGRLSRLWHGPCAEAAGRSIPIVRSEPGPAELVFRLSNSGRLSGRVGLSGAIEVSSPVSANNSRGLPDIYVYLIDTLRADALQSYGSVRDTSPRILDFANDAVVFDRCWSTSAWTLPATMSALTGVLPHRHGFTHGGKRPAEQLVEPLSVQLQRRGYETLAISQSNVISPVFGFDSGFDTFVLSDALARGRLESGSARFFLWHHLRQRSDPQRPLFTFVHTVDPHSPYNPQGEDRIFTRRTSGDLRDWKYDPEYFVSHGLASSPSEVAHLRALYDGEVRHADRHFGAFIDLLELLGAYDDSLIILLSDHGEEFAEHGGFGHTRSLYEELVRVPLIVKFPGSWGAGMRINARASILDLVPTVLRAAAIDFAEAELDGQSLQSLVETARGGAGEGEAIAELIASPSPNGAALDLVSLVVGNIKCVHSATGLDAAGREVGELQVFDLAADPGEQNPLPADSERARSCVDRLTGLLEQRTAAAEIPTEPITAEEKAALQELGYLQ